METNSMIILNNYQISNDFRRTCNSIPFTIPLNGISNIRIWKLVIFWTGLLITLLKCKIVDNNFRIDWSSWKYVQEWKMMKITIEHLNKLDHFNSSYVHCIQSIEIGCQLSMIGIVLRLRTINHWLNVN